MRTGTHPPKGRSFYRLLSFTILFTILLSLPAPASVSAQTSPVATTLTITADSTVVGPDGKFTATVTTAEGGNPTLDPQRYEYSMVFTIDGETYWRCGNLSVSTDDQGVAAAVCETNHDLTIGAHTITASFTSSPFSGASLDYLSSTSTIEYTPTCTSAATVTTGSDELGDDHLTPVPGSLRAVVGDPELCIGATVTFDGDYTISPVQPSAAFFNQYNYILVNRAITIDGSGHNVTLSGDKGALYLAGSNATVPLVLKNVMVTNAGCPIYVMGNVTISNVDFSNNTCGMGGAICNTGILTVLDSTFAGNTANASDVPNDGDGGGGAIYNTENAYLTVSGSTFANNVATYGSGGAINNYNSGHELTVTNSTFSGNSAAWYGGAISIYNGTATLSITNSTFTGNTLTGDNQLRAGAGIYSGGLLMVTNSTFAGNTLTGDTLLGGAGIYSQGFNPTIRNSIVAGNTGGNCSFQQAVTGSNNLSDDPSCVNPAGSTVSPGFTQSSTINLSALADNGGPTQTIALRADSAAIDSGDDAYCPATDQRGVARPHGSHCDVGAFELQYTAAPAVTTQPASAAFPNGTAGTFTAAASGYPEPTVQWQQQTTAAGAQWTDINGATTPTLTFTASASQDGYQYRAVFTNASGSATTAAATMSISGPDSCVVTSDAPYTKDIDGNRNWPAGTLGYWLDATADRPLCATITFGGDMTIVGPIDITHDVTIDGSGYSVAITGDTDNDGTGDAALVAVAYLTDPLAGPTVDVKHLTLENGYGRTTPPVWNSGVLTLDHVTVSRIVGLSWYGALYNRGTLNVFDSSFTGGGSASGTSESNGLYNIGTLNLARSTFSGNASGNAGVLYNGPDWWGQQGNGMTVTITDSTFSNNDDNGIGLIRNLGTMTISGGAFSGNTSVGYGLIFNAIQLNDAGAIIQAGALSVTNSTFSANSATINAGEITTGAPSAGAIAIRNNGDLTLVNNTFAGNSATVGGETGIPAATIYDLASAGRTISIYNNILVKGASGDNCALGTAATVRGGNNLVDDGSCLATGFTQKTTDEIHLGTLGNYGGVTQTIPLEIGSAAVDAGDDANCPATDQRGVTRPYDGDANGTAACDVGAYEVGSFTANTRIDAAPALVSRSGSGSFSFSSGEPGSSFECSLDGAAMSACANPHAVTGLTAGYHTFRVQAIDGSARADPTPASYTWKIETAGGWTEVLGAGYAGTCALQPDGSLDCWGEWNGTQENDQTGPFVSTGIGTDHYCALAPDGVVSCWGNNDDGRATVPAGLSGVTQVTAGGYQTCTLTSTGAAVCWGKATGYDSSGTPADDSTGPYSQISAGGEHNCGVTVSGDVACWGYNSGNGETAGQTATADDPFVQVSAGGSHNCALRSTGAIDCWGSSASGKTTSPTDGPFTQVDAGHSHTCALRSNGTAACWGANNKGETVVPAGEHFVQLSAGEFRSCGLRADGSVLCWGAGGDYGANAPAPGPYGLYAVTAGVPTLTSISPASAQAQTAGVTVNVVGSGFVPTSRVRWNGMDLTTTYVDATHLNAIVPAANLASVGTAQITVHTPAPGGGTSAMQAFFVTTANTTVTGQAVASGDGASATLDGRMATATGSGTVVVASYTADPAGETGFMASSGYFDVYAAPGNSFTEVSIQACNLNGGTKLYWWNGTAWALTATPTYDPSTGCVTLIVNGASSPTLNQLTGTYFAAGQDGAWQFLGFTSPIDNPNVMNSARAAQTIPLKWRLLDAAGAPVTDLTTATVSVVSLNCNLNTTVDAIEEYAAGASGLQNLGDGYYQFNWQTPKSYANSCKMMKLDIGEGVGKEHQALFKFTK